WIWASFASLIPTLASAQPPTGAAQNQSTEPQQPALAVSLIAAGQQPPPSNFQKMYEDIEIMRRIMNRKLGFWPALISLNTTCAACHVVSGSLVRNSQGKFV